MKHQIFVCLFDLRGGLFPSSSSMSLIVVSKMGVADNGEAKFGQLRSACPQSAGAEYERTGADCGPQENSPSGKSWSGHVRAPFELFSGFVATRWFPA